MVLGVKKRIVVAIFALCAIFACVCVMGSPRMPDSILKNGQVQR